MTNRTPLPTTQPQELWRPRVMRFIWRLTGPACVVVCLLSAAQAHAAAAEPGPRREVDLDLSWYKTTTANGPVEALHGRIDKSEARLEFTAGQGYLPALLRELKLLPSSQLLVASKTSANKNYISPKNPRALYFNDSVALAFVPGAEMIEVAAADPKLGVVFYTIEQKPAPRPRLVRDDRCLECHASSKTLNVPGWAVRSFLTHTDGEVDVLSGLMVTHRTPIAERWGGYYVTGDTGGQRHRGNLFGAEAFAKHEKSTAATPSVDDLKPWIDLSKFPATSSDVVPLLVLEHQVQMMNLLTRFRFEAEQIKDEEVFERARPSGEAVLKYLLFIDEARLAAPVRGSSDFAKQFEALGPTDSKGRSLRQFDLRTRLFKLPCSYMIHSPAVESLPLRARRHLYRRLWEVLAGDDKTGEFKTLTPETRRAIREILVETKKDLPAYWRL